MPHRRSRASPANLSSPAPWPPLLPDQSTLPLLGTPRNRVLEQVVSCRDELAQQYLMQALILAFPDDFHLGTLGTLLDALPGLQPGVKVATVLSSLLDRLAS